MDKQIAEFAVIAAYRASRELISLLDTARAHCSEANYDDLQSKVATTLGEMNEINHWAFTAYPELKTAIDERIEKYGRVS
ncbi:hypothetical protein MMA231_01129 [Asticcacaulis sp. MM231]|uniref:hypothetical protein n=1 Tax=Asticcacaulis sp. MM231 TaxID=3157666 RepID=UPI0032D57E7D